MHPLDGVVRRRLEGREELLPGLDQGDVRGLDRAPVDQPQAGITRGGDHVPLAGVPRHQRDHLVRGARVLVGDLAARLLDEGSHPRLVQVSLPADHGQLALAGADLRRQVARLAGAGGRDRQGDCERSDEGAADASHS